MITVYTSEQLSPNDFYCNFSTKKKLMKFRSLSLTLSKKKKKNSYQQQVDLLDISGSRPSDFLKNLQLNLLPLLSLLVVVILLMNLNSFTRNYFLLSNFYKTNWNRFPPQSEFIFIPTYTWLLSMHCFKASFHIYHARCKYIIHLQFCATQLYKPKSS